MQLVLSEGKARLDEIEDSSPSYASVSLHLIIAICVGCATEILEWLGRGA
jgi:hypothetical protein